MKTILKNGVKMLKDILKWIHPFGEYPKIIIVGSGPPKRDPVDILRDPMKMPRWIPVDEDLKKKK